MNLISKLENREGMRLLTPEEEASLSEALQARKDYFRGYFKQRGYECSGSYASFSRALRELIERGGLRKKERKMAHEISNIIGIFVQYNEGLVRNWARDFEEYFKEDLIQEGFCSLIDVAWRFDSSKARFSTFATHSLKNTYANFFRKDSTKSDEMNYYYCPADSDAKAKERNVPLFSILQAREFKTDEEKNSFLENLFGRGILTGFEKSLIREKYLSPGKKVKSDAWVGKKLGFSKGKIMEMRIFAFKKLREMSPDKNLGIDWVRRRNGITPLPPGMIERVDPSPSPLLQVAESERQEQREAFFRNLFNSGTLNDQEVQFIKEKYFTGSIYEPQTDVDVGRKMGLSRQRMGQIKTRAMSKLKEACKNFTPSFELEPLV